MGRDTSIGWTDSTLNCIWGCTKVSGGCKHCYMFRLSKRFARNPEVVTILRSGKDMDYLRQNIRGLGNRIFVNSMSDTFHESLPLTMVRDWFKVFAEFPEKQFQVLTKRINRARAFAKALKVDGGWPANVWLGTSVEDQAHAFRIRTLQLVEGPRIKFVSFEPLIGPVVEPDLSGIQWAIVGGESGETPRPMEQLWAEHLRLVACRYGVVFFFKQLGGKGNDGAGGDLLFGKQYKAYPNEIQVQSRS